MKTIKMMVAGLWIVSGTLLAQVTQERPTTDFTGIKSDGPVTVSITQGASNKVIVSAENDADAFNVKTEVKNGILTVSSSKSNSSIKVNITFVQLNSIEADGTSSLKSTSEIKVTNLSINVDGASSVKLQVDAQNIQAKADGASSLKLSGKAQKIDTKSDGAASIRAEELECAEAVVETDGASSTKVNPKQKITVNADGASSVRMVSEPADKTINVSGMSSVKKIKPITTESKNEGDTTTFKISGKKFMIVGDDDDNDDDNNDSIPDTDKARWESDGKHHKHHHGRKKHSLDSYAHWTGFDIGVNGFLNSSNGLSAPKGYEFTELNHAKSIVFAWNMFDINIPIAKPYIQLITGLGIEWNSYNFRNPVTLNANSSTAMAIQDTTLNFHKNRLKEAWLNVPLLLQLNFSKRPGHSIHLAGGVTVGYKLASWTKQVFEKDGYDFLVKRSDDYLLAPFRVSATVRAGIGDYTLFANYALTELFEKGKGPQLYPFSAGFNIGF